MGKKYLTIDDLLLFCKQSNMNSFSAKDAGGPIIIQSFGEAEVSDTTTMGLTPCTLQACHTELNRNQSFIGENVMQNALASFANRPILGFTHQLEDGTWDFYDHRMAIEEDGDDTRIEYLERPIGVIPESCNAHLEYDKDKDKTYVVVSGYIYDDYGNRAIDIIKEKGGKIDVSVELAINSMSYNAKENYLNIEDFAFMGVTCLGKTPDGTVVKPGMEGSNLKLDNFSVKQNSMFSDDYQIKLIEALDKLNTTLSNFNINNTMKKGGKSMGKLEQLLEAYGFTEEELDFEYEGLSDEELESAFEDYAKRKKKCSEEDDEPIATEEEACKKKKKCSEDDDEPVATEEEAACGKKKKKCSDEDDDPIATEEEACGTKKKKKCSDDDGEDPKDEEPVATEEEAACGGKKKKKCSEGESFVLQYELSHEDIRTALYNLLYEYSDDEYCTAWIINVYDNKFIYQDCVDNRYYRQGYSKDGDIVSLNDDKTEVFNEWLSKEEKDALKALKENYAELKAFKESYDAAELKAQREAVLASEEYSVLADDDEFKALVSNADKYSVEELKVKADLLFAAHMKSTMEFSAKDESAKKPKVIGFNFNKKEEKKSPYGRLFDNK